MKKLFIITAMTAAALVCFAVNAYALDGNTDYYFESGYQSELYQRAEAGYSYDGELNSTIYGIYDTVPPTVYTSEYGSNIIMPSSGNAPATPPANAPAVWQQAPQTVPQPVPLPNTPADGATPVPLPMTPNDTPQLVPLDSDYPDIWANVQIPVQYDVTPVEIMQNADGSIGTLQIPKIGLNIKVYVGDELAAMRKGVGHINGTSTWNSTVGIVGHNRGTNDYFGKLKTLTAGDTVTYTTSAGTRTYKVVFAGQIDDTDWSRLQYTSNNRLVLITCVENVPGKRVCIECVEVL